MSNRRPSPDRGEATFKGIIIDYLRQISDLAGDIAEVVGDSSPESSASHILFHLTQAHGALLTAEQVALSEPPDDEPASVSPPFPVD